MNHGTNKNEAGCFSFHFQFLDNPQNLVRQIYSNPQIYTLILDGLKHYEPYSYVFLTKVSKREVPVYYEIIKNPMDLGTMSKKNYATKEEFKYDLDLIWDNCMYFNGQGIFSEYAEKMKTKADELYDMYFGKEKYTENMNTDYVAVNKNKMKTENKYIITNNACEYQEIYNFDYLETKQKECIKVESLDNVFFDYKTIKVGKNSFFNNQIHNKKCDFCINEECAKSIIEQIILIVLHKIGYKKIQKSAITLFRDIIYDKIQKTMRKIDTKEWFEEIKNIKLTDVNIYTIYDKQDNIEYEREEERKDKIENVINYNIL